MRELQPRHVARLEAILPAFAKPRLPDVLGYGGNCLARCLDMRVEYPRLLDLVGEGPCNRDRLVGGRAEVERPDRNEPSFFSPVFGFTGSRRSTA